MEAFKLKPYIILTVVLMVGSYVTGRYFSQQNQVSVKTSITQTKNEQIKENTHETITEVKEPNGEVKTVTIIGTITTDNTQTQTDTKTQTIPVKRSTINISALAGMSLTSLTPVYGISASKEFIGPITVGAFGLTNGIIGLSVGVNF